MTLHTESDHIHLVMNRRLQKVPRDCSLLVGPLIIMRRDVQGCLIIPWYGSSASPTHPGTSKRHALGYSATPKENAAFRPHSSDEDIIRRRYVTPNHVGC
jgi:hypothetical protein